MRIFAYLGNESGNPIVMKCCIRVGPPDIMTHANLGDDQFRGFWGSGGGRISHFSIDLHCEHYRASVWWSHFPAELSRFIYVGQIITTFKLSLEQKSVLVDEWLIGRWLRLLCVAGQRISTPWIPCCSRGGCDCFWSTVLAFLFDHWLWITRSKCTVSTMHISMIFCRFLFLLTD